MFFLSFILYLRKYKKAIKEDKGGIEPQVKCGSFGYIQIQTMKTFLTAITDVTVGTVLSFWNTMYDAHLIGLSSGLLAVRWTSELTAEADLVLKHTAGTML